MIPYGKQSISEGDIQAVVEVLRSEHLTQGPVVPMFEKAVSTYTGAKFGVATNSATSALHIACLALGVVPGDLVWTTPISFVATSNAALYCGAKIDFVDIDSATYNMSTQKLEDKLVEAQNTGQLPKLVIPVHLAGQSCDMKKIHSLSVRYGFKILEDASHAIGGAYDGDAIGSCKYSDITVFSFHPVKIITTGEGGMALTNDANLASKMMRLRSHGVSRAAGEFTKAPDGQWYYEQLDLGFNYRMTDIQAALGLSQMTRLEEFIVSRREISNKYNELLAMSSIQTPYQDPETKSSWHLYIARINSNEIGFSRNEVFERLRNNGVYVNLHYIPIYRQPFYSRMNFTPQQFPCSEKYYSEAISLPIFPGLTNKQQNSIVNMINSPANFQTLF